MQEVEQPPDAAEIKTEDGLGTAGEPIETGFSGEEVRGADAVSDPIHATTALTDLKAVIEAAIYVTDEPLSTEQIARAVEQPVETVKLVLDQLVAEYALPGRGLSVRELAGGYKMATKPEHHEAIRRFVKNLQPALKLSLAALETLAVIAYRQPVTAPEILAVRGVQGTGVLKTLLDRKLVAPAGRKNVLGKPQLYKTTKEFMVQFGLNSLAELPTLKEFEELGRLALSDSDEYAATGNVENSLTPLEGVHSQNLDLRENREPADTGANENNEQTTDA